MSDSENEQKPNDTQPTIDPNHPRRGSLPDEDDRLPVPSRKITPHAGFQKVLERILSHQDVQRANTPAPEPGGGPSRVQTGPSTGGTEDPISSPLQQPSTSPESNSDPEAVGALPAKQQARPQLPPGLGEEKSLLDNLIENSEVVGYVARIHEHLSHSVTGRAVVEISRCARELKQLHARGHPVFVVNVHDFVTAAIAVERSEVRALCVDLATIKFLAASSMNPQTWLATHGKYFVGSIAEMAQRSGKLLTVDMDT